MSRHKHHASATPVFHREPEVRAQEPEISTRAPVPGPMKDIAEKKHNYCPACGSPLSRLRYTKRFSEHLRHEYRRCKRCGHDFTLEDKS